MQLGKFYKVPAVLVKDWHGFAQAWVPVIGPKHEDAEFIHFPWQHFHVDWRFVSSAIFADFSHWRGKSFVYAYPIQCPDSRGNQVILQGPLLRSMKYKRLWPSYPVSDARWLPDLEAKYACASLAKGVCPHRGIPSSEMIRDGDVLTCPGHGLRWNAVTGAAMPRHSGES